MDTTRAEAFSDGVFAIANALLVLDLRVPDASNLTVGELLQAWPHYFAYVVSFLTIGIGWMNQAGTVVAAPGFPLAALIIFGLLAVCYLFGHLPSPSPG